MTKKIWIAVVKTVGIVGFVTLLIGCATNGGAVNKDYVKFESSVRNSAPKGVIVGVGQSSTKGLTSSLARQTAENRARVDVSRQMSAEVTNGLKDWEEGVEGASFKGGAYQATITTTVSKATLSGTRVFKVETDDSGLNYFVAIVYDVAEAKKLVAAEINKSELANNKKAADAAIADMNAAFDRKFN